MAYLSGAPLWLIIIGVILLIIGFVLYGYNKYQQKEKPWDTWVWVLVIIGAVAIVAGIIWMVVAPKKAAEQAPLRMGSPSAAPGSAFAPSGSYQSSRTYTRSAST